MVIKIVFLACRQDYCYPLTCEDIYYSGYQNSGVYQIYPAETYTPVNVYCDMKTDGGKWTVFQKRMDGSVNFYRDWNAYKLGFGQADGEYWLGLENIYLLTLKKNLELRIDLEDFEGKKVYAKYKNFTLSPQSINGEQEGYRLFIHGFVDGGAGSALTYQNGTKFTTYDRDQDEHGGLNCAKTYSGAFWYNGCHHANPNGLYLSGQHSSFANGVNWYTWKGFYYSLKVVEMKIRPV
ncbi:microfibril-associated glycoprotein 4-like [Protopterus annectens]|uniref:microfibril-associated glycoprotein 4-like n=1 Tax=Protopterus annectens TaxID=7888 RepID=UPI001CFAAA7B|nr:microfibril-associated glycoprotein 4-like [Protopterus annectens]